MTQWYKAVPKLDFDGNPADHGYCPVCGSLSTDLSFQEVWVVHKLEPIDDDEHTVLMLENGGRTVWETKPSRQ